MQEDIGVRKGGRQLYSPMVLQPRWQSGGPLLGAVKGRSKPMFTRLPNSSHNMPTIAHDTIVVSKTGPTIDMGLL
jgi:hypothetical protein